MTKPFRNCNDGGLVTDEEVTCHKCVRTFYRYTRLDDLEELVHLEQTLFDAGYKDGFAHGCIHGLIEGRALGDEKGFEIWEELRFYEGFASTWQAVCLQRGQRDQDQRALHHIKPLPDLIRQFPTVNPSATCATLPSNESIDTDSELDISKLQRQIRSRYKALYASLGVRPTLRAGPVPHAPRSGFLGTKKKTVHIHTKKRSVWSIEWGDENGEVGRAPCRG